MQEAFFVFSEMLWVILAERQLYATAFPSVSGVSLFHLNVDLFPSLKNLPEHRIRPKFLFESFTKKILHQSLTFLIFIQCFFPMTLSLIIC